MCRLAIIVWKSSGKVCRWNSSKVLAEYPIADEDLSNGTDVISRYDLSYRLKK